MMKRVRGSDDRVAEYAPFYREFLTARNLLIVAICLISLLIGCILLLSTMSSTPGLFTPGSILAFFFVTLLLNGSIGVLVSLLISSIILRDQRFEVQTDLDRRIDALAGNVFAGVLAVEHDPSYVDLVRRRILVAHFVRDEVSISVEMKAIPTLAGDPRQRRFTLLAADVRYVQRNISVEPRSVPIVVLVPNPIVPAARELVQLTYAKIDDNLLPPEQIVELNLEGQRQLAAPGNIEARFELGERLLQSGESVEVAFRYDIVKEDEDNEMILTSHPTRQMDLSVRDSTGRNLVLFAKSIHSSPIYPSNSGMVLDGWAQWRLTDWAFPRQGVLFWWKLPVAAEAKVLEIATDDATCQNNSSKDMSGETRRGKMMALVRRTFGLD